MPNLPPQMMQALMNDPELMAAFQSPKVMAAFADIQSNPGVHALPRPMADVWPTGLL